MNYPRCKDFLCCCVSRERTMSTKNCNDRRNRKYYEENKQCEIVSRERKENMEMSVFLYQKRVTQPKNLKVDTYITTSLSFGESGRSTMALTTQSDKTAVL